MKNTIKIIVVFIIINFISIKVYSQDLLDYSKINFVQKLWYKAVKTPVTKAYLFKYTDKSKEYEADNIIGSIMTNSRKEKKTLKRNPVSFCIYKGLMSEMIGDNIKMYFYFSIANRLISDYHITRRDKYNIDMLEIKNFYDYINNKKTQKNNNHTDTIIINLRIDSLRNYNKELYCNNIQFKYNYFKLDTLIKKNNLRIIKILDSITNHSDYDIIHSDYSKTKTIKLNLNYLPPKDTLSYINNFFSKDTSKIFNNILNFMGLCQIWWVIKFEFSTNKVNYIYKIEIVLHKKTFSN